jgi:hypothetical protein
MPDLCSEDFKGTLKSDMQGSVDGFSKRVHTNRAGEPLEKIQCLNNKKNHISISVPSSFNKRSLSSGFAGIS